MTQDAGQKRVEVGTGLESFEPLEPGQPLELARGLQGGGRYGGFHVWMGLRTVGVSDAAAELSVHLPDGTLLGAGTHTLRLQEAPDGSAFAGGLRVILSDCCLAEHQRLELAAEISDTSGWSGSDVVEVVATECPPGPPDPRIDPCEG